MQVPVINGVKEMNPKCRVCSGACKQNKLVDIITCPYFKHVKSS